MKCLAYEEDKLKKFFEKQLGHLLFGVIVWLPIVIIAIVGVWLFKSIDSAGQGLLGVLSFEKPVPNGLGFLTILFLIYVSGVLLKKTRVRNFAAKIPVLGGLIGGNGKGQTMGLEKLLKLQPCLFLYSPTSPSYGFILSEVGVEMGGKDAGLVLINIYFPNVPTIVMGQVFPVRRETVMRLGNPAAEIISLLLYASRNPESIRYLPWPEETEEGFKKRAENFGI